MVLHTAAILSFEDVGKEIKFALLIILLKQPCGISIMRLKQESLILVDNAFNTGGYFLLMK